MNVPIAARTNFPHIKLVGAYTSPFTRKIRVTLGEKGIPFDYTGESTKGQAPHNPLGLVPVIVVDGKDIIFDSAVIIEYLEMLCPTPAILPGGMDRIIVRRWEALTDGICDAGGICMKENRRNENRSQEQVDRQSRRFERGLEAASKELGDNQWCHGNAYSLADICLGITYAWMGMRFPERAEDWKVRHPNLHALHERLMQRPAFASTPPTRMLQAEPSPS